MQSKKIANLPVFTTPTPLVYNFLTPVISLEAKVSIGLIYRCFEPIQFNLLNYWAKLESVGER